MPSPQLSAALPRRRRRCPGASSHRATEAGVSGSDPCAARAGRQQVTPLRPGHSFLPRGISSPAGSPSSAEWGAQSRGSGASAPERGWKEAREGTKRSGTNRPLRSRLHTGPQTKGPRPARGTAGRPASPAARVCPAGSAQRGPPGGGPDLRGEQGLLDAAVFAFPEHIPPGKAPTEEGVGKRGKLRPGA